MHSFLIHKVRTVSRGREYIPRLLCITYNLYTSATNTAIGKICLITDNYDFSLDSVLANRNFNIYFIFITVSWSKFFDNSQITDE